MILLFPPPRPFLPSTPLLHLLPSPLSHVFYLSLSLSSSSSPFKLTFLFLSLSSFSSLDFSASSSSFSSLPTFLTSHFRFPLFLLLSPLSISISSMLSLILSPLSLFLSTLSPTPPSNPSSFSLHYNSPHLLSPHSYLLLSFGQSPLIRRNTCSAYMARRLFCAAITCCLMPPLSLPADNILYPRRAPSLPTPSFLQFYSPLLFFTVATISLSLLLAPESAESVFPNFFPPI